MKHEVQFKFTGSGVSLSSSEGLGVVPRELFDVVRGVLDLDSASESLHCSTSTSSSSSPSLKRFIEVGPNLIKIQSIPMDFYANHFTNCRRSEIVVVRAI